MHGPLGNIFLRAGG